MRILSFLVCLILSIAAHAGERKFNLRQVSADAKHLGPQKLKQLGWLPGSLQFAFIDPQQERCLQLRDATGIELIKSLCVDEINLHMVEAGFGKLSIFPELVWNKPNRFLFWHKQRLLAYDMEKSEISLINTVPENAENIHYHKAHPEKVAYTQGKDLFIAVNGDQVQLSNATAESDVTYGQVVHRNEFGISRGTFWSSNGKYLAFYRNDESLVYNYPNVDYEESPAEYKPFKYPMAGTNNEKVSVGIYDVEHKHTIYLDTGSDTDQYLTGITFGPDENTVYVTILNRQQTHLELVAFDPKDGHKTASILHEENKKYVEPETGPMFPENRSDKFVWLSRNNGFRHIFLVDLMSKQMEQLTSGAWEIDAFDGFSTCGQWAYFHGRLDSVLEKHFYRVNLVNKKVERLTQEKGMHHALLSSDDRFLLDSFENSKLPWRLDLFDLSQGQASKVYEAKNPLADYDLGITEIISLSKDDDVKLFARMIKPPDFQVDRQYPVLVYVYGGPHVQLVDESWLNGASLWLHFMAQKGYLIFTIDNRGSHKRGLEFEQASYGELGKVELEDQLFGVEYLRQLPFVDPQRMGVFGWSFGGFMASTLMLKSPEVFKVGVAGGAVIDWSLYEIMYTERYMGTPAANPNGFEASNLLNFVDQLQGKLLLVHGTNDPVVVWQHSLKLAKKAASLGVPLDYYPYVGHGHGVRGEEQFHLYQKISAYIDQALAK